MGCTRSGIIVVIVADTSLQKDNEASIMPRVEVGYTTQEAAQVRAALLLLQRQAIEAVQALDQNSRYPSTDF